MSAVIEFFSDTFCFLLWALFLGACIAIILACPALFLVYIFLFAKIW